MSHPTKGRRPARPPAPARGGCGGCLGGVLCIILAVIFWKWVLIGLALLPVLYLLSIFAAGIGKAAFTSPRSGG